MKTQKKSVNVTPFRGGGSILDRAQKQLIVFLSSAPLIQLSRLWLKIFYGPRKVSKKSFFMSQSEIAVVIVFRLKIPDENFTPTESLQSKLTQFPSLAFPGWRPFQSTHNFLLGISFGFARLVYIFAIDTIQNILEFAILSFQISSSPN